MEAEDQERTRKYFQLLEMVEQLGRSEKSEDEFVEDYNSLVANSSSVRGMKPQDFLFSLRIWDNATLAMKERVEKLCTGSTLSLDDFAEHLTKTFQDGKNKWSFLEESCKKIFPAHIKFSCLQRTLDKPPVIPKERVRRKMDQPKSQASQSQPEKITPNSDEGPVNDHIPHVYSALKRMYQKNNKKEVSCLKFVLDPSSFSKTVQNIFTLSFLVRDDLAKLSTGERNQLLVKPGKKNETGGNRRSDEKCQMVFSLNYATWKKLVDASKIETPAIPPF